MFYNSPKHKHNFCAIYRGAGGAGDATGDSASEALLVRDLAAQVVADAAAAASSKAAAEAAKVAAQLAETNAETAETNAETAEVNAETAETNAETAATASASSASSASASASTASTQASNASTSASAASGSASAASTSATNASNSASTATTQATNASNSATTASTSATNASNSASAAATSATNAATSESNAAATLANAAIKNATNTFTANQVISVTDNSNAALRITQLGTGNALLVEDSTNPDASPFVIDAGGRLLSGFTTAPAGGFKQYTNGSTFATSSVRVGDNTDGSTSGMLQNLSNSTKSTVISADPDNLGANTVLLFDVDGTERMRITNAGNVGIGKTPTTKLDVNGTVTATAFVGNGAGLTGVAGGQYFGSAAVKAIAYNSQTIAENVTVTAGNNGGSFGPISIDSGFTVTVESGANWIIV